jgi:hypothetical protein
MVSEQRVRASNTPSHETSSFSREAMAARRKGSRTRLEPHEITIHFDDPDASSREVLKALKGLGFEPDITPQQLDALRARGDELRAWLKNRPDRHDAFVRDPAAVLGAMGVPPQRATSRRRGTPPRWSAVGRSAELAAAGLELRRWALAEPGRLAQVLKDPAGVIDAALSDRTPALRKRVAAAMSPPAKPATKKESRRRSSP